MPVCRNPKCNLGKFDFPKLARFRDSKLAWWECGICRSRYDKDLNEIKFKCFRCEAEKSVGEFKVEKRTVKGFESTCRECVNKIKREAYALNKMREKLDKIESIANEAGINKAIARLIIDKYNEQ